MIVSGLDNGRIVCDLYSCGTDSVAMCTHSRLGMIRKEEGLIKNIRMKRSKKGNSYRDLKT